MKENIGTHRRVTCAYLHDLGWQKFTLKKATPSKSRDDHIAIENQPQLWSQSLLRTSY